MQTEIAPTDTPETLKSAAEEAVSLLSEGQVVALPTETVYGLAADATNPDAVARIFEAKNRPSFDPLIVHVINLLQVEEIADIPEDVKAVVAELMEKFWPGPLTFVLPKKPVIPDIVTSGLGTVAVRSSSDPVFRKVLKEFGKPLAAPSANRFGSISPTSASAVITELGGSIPLVLDGGACACGLESTIVKIEPSNRPINPDASASKQRAAAKPIIHVLRSGPVTAEDLKPFGKIARVERNPDSPEAPGQLESHYAPATPLRLLERPEDFVPEPGKKYALLSYRGAPKDGYVDLMEFEELEVLSPGSGKMPEAAVRFFHLLRKLDSSGVDEIIAEPVPERGLGVAIMERLRRAAHAD